MQKWRSKIHEVIFGTDTFSGKLFDIILLILILLSVITVFLESVKTFRIANQEVFYRVEWFFTIIFTIEYFARILSHRKPAKYILGFWGVIDLLAILPTYISLVFVGTQYLLVVRMIRLIRVFRILKLARYIREGENLAKALKGSLYKITMFLFIVVILVVVMGAIMYLVEGEENGFTSIPRSIYWAIVTLTTVGYGDIAPQTVLGQTIASVIMIIGYSIIAVPTGIVTAELSNAKNVKNIKKCKNCDNVITEPEAKFCLWCGEKLR